MSTLIGAPELTLDAQPRYVTPKVRHSQGVEDVRQLMQTIGRLTQDSRYDEVRSAFLDWATHVLLPRALDGQPTPARYEAFILTSVELKSISVKYSTALSDL